MTDNVPRLAFRKQQREQFESTSDELVESALTVYDEFHGHPKAAKHWKLVKRRNSLNVYKHRDKPPSSCEKDRTYLCSGVMPGSVEEMLHGAYSDDTESMRIGLSLMMPMFLDARMVHVFEKNPLTSNVVFSGIKWMTFKTSISATLIHDREMLLYNRLGRIIDQRGRYFVYCVLKSVELDEFPANHHHLKRGLVSMCYLFRQFQEDLVGCFITGTASMGGTLPRSVVEVITIGRMLSVQNILLVARAKAYSARIAHSIDQIPSTSNVCDVCMKKPKLLSSSFQLCMGCRRNTCRKCREWCTVFQLDARTHKPSKERFCTQCISDVTRPTISTFYMCSLNESTNHSVNYQGSTSTSISSGARQSSCPSSSRSHDMLEIDSDPWLPAPPDLDNLATFVERASLAHSIDLQWNQDELDYYIDILRESGHLKVPEFTEYTNRPTQTSKQFFSSSSSLLPPVPSKDVGNTSPSYAADDNSSHRKFFSVDDLD